MGNEITCKIHLDGKSFTGKVLLETTEILVRGENRLKIPFAAVTALMAKDGELHVRTKEGLTVFVLGAKAEKWRSKIANPKSLVEKLGPKQGESIQVIGKFDPGFLVDLKKTGATLVDGKGSAGAGWIFLRIEAQTDLEKIKKVAKAMRGAAALWIVYPKGQKSLTENDVRGAGLNAGLTDVKVTRFSDTHTALKFVIPAAKR